MTAKEYLSQAYRLDKRIDSKLEQLSDLRDTTTKATAVMNNTPVSHTRNVHSLQDTIAKIVDMEHELDRDIDALVVCGSPGQNPATGAGLLLNRVMTAFKGDRYVSPMFINMATGSFSKAFPSPDTKNAWLSTNQDNVKRYDADPLCGFPFTLNGYKALLELMRDAYNPVPAGHPDLPVHFLSGEHDPCAPDRKGFEAAVQRVKDDGYRTVTAKMYPGMRHEVLNHAERQIVFDDLAALLDGWTAKK
jgi:alpha-beta hydrolase superfamily lysophospholipase